MKGKYNYFDDDYEYIETPFDKIKNAIQTAKQTYSNDKGTTVKNFADHITKRVKEKEKLTTGRKTLLILSMIFVFIFVVCVFVLLVVNSVNIQNKKNQQFKSDAGSVCSTYAKEYGNCAYENMYSVYGIEGYRMTGVCYAREMDFNADGNSELLICYCDGRTYYVEIWGYVDDEFVSIYHSNATQTQNKEDDVWITIRYGDGKYYIGCHDKDDITQVDLYALKKDSFVLKDSCVYDEINEAFYVDDELDTAFERIKLSVLREEKAESVYNTVTDTIDGFSTSESPIVANVNNTRSINTVYYEIINEYNQKYGEAEFVKSGNLAYVDGLALVRLVDFNNDDIPELVLGYHKGVKVRDEDNQGNYISRLEYKYCCEIYTYKNNRAVRVFENEGISAKVGNTDDVYFMYKRNHNKNQLCINTYSNLNYGQKVHASSTIYDFDGTEFEIEKKAEYDAEYGYYHYYIDNERVYSSQFNREGYFLPLFNGSDNYDSDLYTVIYLSRASNNSADVQPTVEQTVKAIQQLNSGYSPKSTD